MFLVPRIFPDASLTPAASKTTLIGPPAIIPDPGGAGLSRIREAENFSSIEKGIVVPLKGKVTSFLFALLIDLRIAFTTLGAFDNPIPTRPFLSPTTTNAENLIVFPPFVFLLILFISTTFSEKQHR